MYVSVKESEIVADTNRERVSDRVKKERSTRKESMRQRGSGWARETGQKESER